MSHDVVITPDNDDDDDETIERATGYYCDGIARHNARAFLRLRGQSNGKPLDKTPTRLAECAVSTTKGDNAESSVGAGEARRARGK